MTQAGPQRTGMSERETNTIRVENLVQFETLRFFQRAAETRLGWY